MNQLSVSKSHKILKQWHSAIDIITMLHTLCGDLRAHRGASTALLGGDLFFQSASKSYAENIDKQLLKLEKSLQYDKDNIVVVSSLEDFISIQDKWQLIQQHLKRHPQLSNFYAHCQLLNDIQTLIWQLAIQADPSLTGNSHKALLSRFILKHHADTMESIARLRGYACTFCANGELSDEQSLLLSDEIDEVLNIWHKRQIAFETLPLEYYSQVEQLNQQTSLKQYLLDFIELVRPMCRKESELPNGSEIFNQANKALNLCNIQYVNGIDVLKNILPPEILEWIRTPVKS